MRIFLCTFATVLLSSCLSTDLLCNLHKHFKNNCHLIWLNCRLAVRHAAAITKKFASSIAPHITTILVHGKQVMFRQRCSQVRA